MNILLNPSLNRSFPIYTSFCNFYGNTSNKDFFTEFTNLMKVFHKTPNDLKNDCKKENIIGSGQNSIVYKFNNQNFDNWVIKLDIGSINDNTIFSNPIEKVPSEFGSENMGQEVAKLGEHVHILRKIKGNPHSIPDWSLHRKNMTPITKEQSINFLNSIKEISNFPQQSFNNFARKIQLLDEKGYKADSFNPNNLIINTEQKEIHVIDAYKYDVDAHLNTKYDMFCPLVDYANFDKYYYALPGESKEEFLNVSKIIFDKVTLAAKNIGIKTDEHIFKDFIARIDKRENNNGVYTNSFNILKGLLKI